jgi:hypothetical protein
MCIDKADENSDVENEKNIYNRNWIATAYDMLSKSTVNFATKFFKHSFSFNVFHRLSQTPLSTGRQRFADKDVVISTS